MNDLATRIRERIARYPESAKMFRRDIWNLLEEAAATLEALLSAHIQTPAFEKEVCEHALDNECVDLAA